MNNIRKLLFIAFIFLLSACGEDDYLAKSPTQPTDSTADFYGERPICNELVHKTPTKTCYLLWCGGYKKAGLTTL